MNKEEIAFLMENGFSLAEIMIIMKKAENPKPDEPKPADQKPDEKKPDEQKPGKDPENVSGTRSDNGKSEEKQNETDSLKNEIAELKKMIQNQNRKNAQQPYAEPERTIEDIFNDLINPKRKGDDEK